MNSYRDHQPFKAYLEPWEVAALAVAATNLRDRLLIRLLFRTGCRVSELVGLRVDDLDLEAETVRVVRLKERLQVSCPQCGTRLGVCVSNQSAKSGRGRKMASPRYGPRITHTHS